MAGVDRSSTAVVVTRGVFSRGMYKKGIFGKNRRILVQQSCSASVRMFADEEEDEEEGGRRFFGYRR